jgi:hypothetical protein
MDTERLGLRVDGINERIKKLSFNFADEDTAKEAEQLKEEAIAMLDEYVELALKDNEQSPDTESDEG